MGNNQKVSTSAGLYEIRNIRKGTRYVGSARNLNRRWIAHRSCLGRGVHDNPRLQRAWNRDGAESFQFCVLVFLEESDLIATEQRLLDQVVGTEGCYNMAPVANAPIYGRKASKETRAKMSAAAKGRKLPPRSEEHRRRLSEAVKGRKGKPLSEDHKRAISEANKGKSISEEHKQAISASSRGRKRPWLAERNRSEEHRLKSSTARKGKSREPLSAEHKKAISQALLSSHKVGPGRFEKGREVSLEERIRLRDAAVGRKWGPHSEDAKKKMSEAKSGKPWSEARRKAQEQGKLHN